MQWDSPEDAITGHVASALFYGALARRIWTKMYPDTTAVERPHEAHKPVQSQPSSALAHPLQGTRYVSEAVLDAPDQLSHQLVTTGWFLSRPNEQRNDSAEHCWNCWLTFWVIIKCLQFKLKLSWNKHLCAAYLKKCTWPDFVRFVVTGSLELCFHVL